MDKTKKLSKKAKIGIICGVVALVLAIAGCIIYFVSSNADIDYSNNDMYKVYCEYKYTDEYGITHIIHRISAKKSTHVQGTLIAYGKDGEILTTVVSSIYLIEGGENYFDYTISEDPEDIIEYTYTVKELDDYPSSNVEYNTLVLTSKTPVERLAYNEIPVCQLYDLCDDSSFKVLIFNKTGHLICSYYGLVSDCAKNLDGIGSEGILELKGLDTNIDMELDLISFMYTIG